MHTFLIVENEVTRMVKKSQMDTLFIHLNTVDSYIKFTVEYPGKNGSIPNHSVQMSVFRKQTYTDCYLDWNLNRPISAKKLVVSALICRARNLCSPPEILAKEMDYLHHLLLKNNYHEKIIKQQNVVYKCSCHERTVITSTLVNPVVA